MKKIYFVRHGESIGNVGPVIQTDSEPLTQYGREQAEIVSKRFPDIPIDIIISSTLARAIETAEIISDEVGHPVEQTSLFIERRRPIEQRGQLKDDKDAIKSAKDIIDNFHVPGYRFSDEENFEDLKERARKALNYLANRKEDHIIVVTHGFFMRIIIGYVVLGEKLTSVQGKEFILAFNLDNIGISTIRTSERGNISGWNICSWNDYGQFS